MNLQIQLRFSIILFLILYHAMPGKSGFFGLAATLNGECPFQRREGPNQIMTTAAKSRIVSSTVFDPFIFHR